MNDVSRRLFITGAAAVAAGGATAGATGLLSSPPNSAGAHSDTAATHTYVATHGSDENTGHNWDNAVATIHTALKRSNYGTVHVGPGNYEGGFTIGRQAIRGAGRDATFIANTSNSQSIVTMTDGALLSDLNIVGSPNFAGSGILITGTLVHVQDVDVKTDADPHHNFQGTGIVTRDGEGCLFTRVACTRQRLAWHIGGANHVFVDMRGDSNYQDILIGENEASDPATFKESGAHLILGSKFVEGGNTGIQGAPGVACIRIHGSGENTLIDCDWEEADKAYWELTSDNNVLTRCAVAPGTFLTVSGAFNTISGLKILGAATITGSDNTIWNTFAPYAGGLTVNGARNLVYGENGSAATGSGIRRLSFS
ncbi:MAG: hypothetical protein JOZ07_00140 [Solirubrobacterales bacterium]|nr:hypothetical protein [Solirubrobacterales bacterium]